MGTHWTPPKRFPCWIDPKSTCFTRDPLNELEKVFWPAQMHSFRVAPSPLRKVWKNHLDMCQNGGPRKRWFSLGFPSNNPKKGLLQNQRLFPKGKKRSDHTNQSCYKAPSTPRWFSSAHRFQLKLCIYKEAGWPATWLGCGRHTAGQSYSQPRARGWG